MHNAAQNGHKQVLRVLLEHGADFNLKAKVLLSAAKFFILFGQLFTPFAVFVYFL